MQKISCDLDAVRGRYETILARLEPEARSLPIARARFVGFTGAAAEHEARSLANAREGADANDDGEDHAAPGMVFEVEVEATGRAECSILLKVREKANTPLHQIRAVTRQVQPRERVRVTVPGTSDWLEGFDFQIGAREGSDGPYFHSRWQTVVRAEAP